MPITIFKRRSFKNLRKRSKKDENSSEQEPLPPLPSANGIDKEDYNSEAEISRDIIVSDEKSLVVSKSSLYNATSRQDAVGEDSLASAWAVAYGPPPPPSKTGLKIEEMGNRIMSEEETTNVINGAVLITAAAAVLDITGGLDGITDKINNFLEGSSVLVGALDEVAKLHPFIGVAVLAFKAVWTLEMKRRENDRKIIALYAEMKDTMAVLVQLKTVKDVTEIAPDGTTIAGRMQELAEATARDIKSCANACDTYAKKKLIVKVLVGPAWENRFLDFFNVFAKRRTEFEFALTIHTARGVDAANEALDGLNKTTEDINAKMDLMMQMFKQMVSPEQKEMTRLVEQKGGAKAVQDNEKILAELNDLDQKTSVSLVSTGPPRASNKNEMKEILDDLHTDPDEAIAKNMTVFLRKFEIQQRQITEELTRVVQREGDRIISAITSGPHDRLLDPDVFEIWKEMNWRGSVKARHFVMALRDYFHEKWNANSPTDGTSGAIALDAKHPEDDWALAYINTVKLQPISEAFDDDASGFITLAEVNTFTTSRPLGWSLPHWIAYWAVGWHMTLTNYSSKIQELTGKMFAILPNIRPENRNFVNDYLLNVYQRVTTLQASINGSYRNEALQARFQSYVDAEEERLRKNLEAVDYDIDAMDTLVLVTGPGRIEKFVLPVLYLLLKQHFEIFRVAQKRIIHHDELFDAADTIEWVFDATADRYKVLQAIFKQQKLDEKQQFKVFAHGLFEHWHNPSGLWAPAIVRESDPQEFPYNEALESQDVKAEIVCNYPLDQQDIHYSVYESGNSDTLPQPDEEISSVLKPILGAWCGYIYYGEFATRMSLYMFLPKGQNNEFQANGAVADTEFTVVGKCEAGNTPDIISITFKRMFRARHPQQYFTGSFDVSTESIQGRIANTPGDAPTTHPFLLKRTPPEIFRFYPLPKALKANKACALWQFAITATLSQVRHQLWSWSLFKERRDARNKFIRFLIRDTKFGKPLSPAERAEFNVVQRQLMPIDVRFYNSLALHQIRITPIHGCNCDHCDGNIGGSRILCLMCQTKDTWDSVDLCDEQECMAAEVTRHDLTKIHRPTHDLVKVRRVVHLRQHGQLDRESKEALEKARDILGSEDANESEPLGAENGEDAEKPKCALCAKEVSQPCWFCVQCEEEPTFLCNDCDNSGAARFEEYEGPHDYYTHDLVRCQKFVKDEDISMEERLTGLEERLSRHENNMNERLTALEMKFDERLSKIDAMLGMILTNMVEKRVGETE